MSSVVTPMARAEDSCLPGTGTSALRPMPVHVSKRQPQLSTLPRHRSVSINAENASQVITTPVSLSQSKSSRFAPARPGPSAKPIPRLTTADSSNIPAAVKSTTSDSLEVPQTCGEVSMTAGDIITTSNASILASSKNKSPSSPAYSYKDDTWEDLKDDEYPNFKFKIKMVNLGTPDDVVNVITTSHADLLPAPFRMLPGYPKPTIGDLWGHRSKLANEKQEALQVWIFYEQKMSKASTSGEGIWQNMGAQIADQSSHIEFPERTNKPLPSKRCFSLRLNGDLNWVQKHPNRGLPEKLIIIPHGDANSDDSGNPDDK